jgi:hypothetical protein
MVLGIIVLSLSTMVAWKEIRAVIIALHKKGFTDIAASKIAPNHLSDHQELQGRAVQMLQRMLQGAQESPASARTVS